MAIDEQLRNEVEAWIGDDPDPDTRSELQALLDAGEEDALRERFAGPLEFGTAGLRGLLGGGPNRMNRAVVLRATAGLCAHVEANVPRAAERGICIGFDGRTKSRTFAEDVAAVVAGAGLVARVFPHPVPTPLLAFAAIDRGAAASVIVTASHNPPDYNGYKVYWENGAQIIPPHDEAIAARIAEVDRVHDVPYVGADQAASRGLREVLGEEVADRYLEGVQRLAVHPETPRDLTVAHTSLHGVGAPYVRQAFRTLGFDALWEVPEQAEPDARFPTVRFPNPEEEGAMDRVLALARERGAELALANDPDADRLAAAVRRSDGTYRMLTGNEIGCLLAHYLLQPHGTSEPARRDVPLVINTLVSSPMLGSIAAAHGARWERTLTGFKWIANRAMELEPRGYRFVFGYEEALGYCAGTLVRDKDGISAAAVLADMAAWCRHDGRTLLDELERCWRRYGMFLSRQISVTHEGTRGQDRIRAVMEQARAHPPSSVGGYEVEAVEDLRAGRRTPREGTSEPLSFPPADVLGLDLADGHRVMLRPSGTEPKLKYYIDVRIDPRDDETTAGSQERGTTLLDAIAEDLQRVLQ